MEPSHPDTRINRMRRTSLGIVAMVLGALLLLVGALLVDAARLLQRDAFADRVAASLGDPRVSTLVAEHITRAIIAQRRDLTAYRPLILAAANDVVRSDTFRGVARTTAREAHTALFSPRGRSLLLSIPDLDIVLRSALATSSQVAESVPQQVVVGIADLENSPAVRVAIEVIRSGLLVSRSAWIALSLGTLLLFAGVMVPHDRRKALVAVGATLMVTGIALWSIERIGSGMVDDFVDDRQIAGAVAGLWSVALPGVPWWGLTYAAIGVVLAAAGSSLLERIRLRDIRDLFKRMFLEEQAHGSTRVVTSIVITSVGIALVLAPIKVLTIAGIIAGFMVMFVGLRDIFAVILHSSPAHERFAEALAHGRKGWAVGIGVVVLYVSLFMAGLTLVRQTTAGRIKPTTIDACNGYSALCDRRLNDVVFAGTHNSMASSDKQDWLFPHQERGIAAQLDDGVRAFLIDVYYGNAVDGHVLTDSTSEASVARRRLLGEEGEAAAMRIRNRLLAGDAGPRELYLCHSFCELGAVRADSVLKQIHEFLIRHPNDVVILIIEDHVAPGDIAESFVRTGLRRLVYRGESGEEWLTLRELIASDQRLIATIESGSRGVEYLLPAFQVFQETAFAFTNASEPMACAPNRGDTTGSLFLLNHWIETTPTPRPSNAATVNALDVILERARRCQRERGIQPNVIAVDFYRTGDVLRAAGILNGVEK